MEFPDVITADTRLVARFVSDEMVHLLDEQWFVMENWKWIALSAALAIGIILRPALQYFLKKVRRVLRGRQGSQTFWQYFLDFPQEKSLAWILICLLWLTAFDALNLPPTLDKYLSLVVKVILAWNIVSLAYLAVDAVGRLFLRMTEKSSTLESQLAPFATKVLKVMVLVLGILISLQNFGVNVVSLLAGLGLGGLALALAAQDTVANLFGSVTILFDNPFKVGDWVKVGEVEGIVEEVGFRSTRIRTFYNSLVTMPNSIIAKEKIDNMGVRPRRRVKQSVFFALENPATKLREYCAAMASYVKQNTNVDTDVSVTLGNFSKNAVEVVVVFNLKGVNGDQEVAITQWAYDGMLETANRLELRFPPIAREFEVARGGA